MPTTQKEVSEIVEVEEFVDLLEASEVEESVDLGDCLVYKVHHRRRGPLVLVQTASTGKAAVLKPTIT